MTSPTSVKSSILTLMNEQHYGIEPVFLMFAGISASTAQQIVQHPLNLIQRVHYKLAAATEKSDTTSQPRNAYWDTYQKCAIHAQRAGGWRRWLYRRFLINTIKQVPSTSAGLVMFELVRRRYGSEAEAVRIEKKGYDLLLN